MSVSEEMMREKAIQLAKDGKLMDRIFQIFWKTVFPHANESQIHAMRLCFYAGAAETHSLMHLVAEGDDSEDEKMDFMNCWVDELMEFHQATVERHCHQPSGRA